MYSTSELDELFLILISIKGFKLKREYNHTGTTQHYTKVKSFVGLVGHYWYFIKGFAKIAAPLYDLTSGDNRDKKSKHVDLSLEAQEAFDHLKAACLQAPILAFPDFN